MIYKLLNLQTLLIFAVEVQSAKKESKPENSLHYLDGRFAGNTLPRSPASQAFGSS